MTPEEKKAIETLIQEIEGRKGDSRSATYRDSPALFKIAQLLNKVAIESKDDLKIAFQCNRYLAYQYRSMGRASVAAIYGEAAIKAAKRLLQEHGELLEETEEVFRGLLGDRNRFVDDDCDDLRDLISGLLPEKQIEETYAYRLGHRRHLKADPIEMSEEYLAVIDEVEERIEKNRKYHGMGSCYETWALKEQYLLEKGIRWKSPHILNPRVMFD